MRRVQEGLSAAGAHPLHPAQGPQLLQVFLLHIHSGKLSPNSGGRRKEGRLSSRRRTTKGMFAARKTEATPPSDLQASLVQDRLESKSFCYQSPFPFCAPYCTNIKRWPSLRRSQKRALLKAQSSLRWMWRNNCSPLMQRQTQCPLQVSHDDESNHHIIPSSVFHCLLSSFCHLSVFSLCPFCLLPLQ